ncbi:MAG: sensor histidine kinase, partial [Myxococcales bacterium]
AERLAERRSLQREVAEHANRTKNDFLSRMSHELRTPLNAVIGFSQLLLREPLAERDAESVNQIHRAGLHLLDLINEVLDISRIEAGKMPLHFEEFALQALLSELLAEVEPLIQKARLQTQVELSPELPALYSDRQKVKQVVLNLLTNAIKFTPQGFVKVRVAADEARREVRVAVQDTGIGIAPQDRDKVFEDFRQADNSVTREYGGAGLGLAICRRLATMLGGRIELDSELGRGSTFTLVIPRRGKRR